MAADEPFPRGVTQYMSSSRGPVVAVFSYCSLAVKATVGEQLGSSHGREGAAGAIVHRGEGARLAECEWVTAG